MSLSSDYIAQVLRDAKGGKCQDCVEHLRHLLVVSLGVGTLQRKAYAALVWRQRNGITSRELAAHLSINRDGSVSIRSACNILRRLEKLGLLEKEINPRQQGYLWKPKYLIEEVSNG